MFSLIVSLLVFVVPSNADEANQSTDNKTTTQSNVRVAERNVQTQAGQFNVTLQQTPSDPRTGEEVKFIFVVNEKIEGGFAGIESQPLTNAKVVVRVQNVKGQTLANNLQTKAEANGSYVLNYAFSSYSDYKIVLDVRTKDDRTFNVDFPVTIVNAPVNWTFWLGLGLITLLSFGTIFGYFAGLKGDEIDFATRLRKTLPVLIAAFVFFIVGTIALAYFQPPRERRNITELQTANGEEKALLPKADDESAAITITKESQLLFGIKTEVVTERQITGGLKVAGVVKAKPDSRAVVLPPVSGRVLLRKGLTIGSAVGRGEQIGTVEQVLGAPEQADLEARRIELRTAALEQQAKQAEQNALAQQARTRLSQAQRELQRAKNLLEVGAAPKKRVEEAETAVRLAEQEVKSAEQQAAIANQQAKLANESVNRVNPIRTFALISPITGLISELKVTTGQQVETGTELINISNLTTVFIEAQVFEKELETVRSSNRASFTAAGIPDEVFNIGKDGDGFLLTIGQNVNAETRTVPVIFEIKNSLNRLRDGMFVDITIDTTGSEKIIAVPKRAVITEQGKTFVFVFKGGETFEKRIVVIGNEGLDFYAVRSGLSTNERVVVDGIYQLRSAY